MRLAISAFPSGIRPKGFVVSLFLFIFFGFCSLQAEDLTVYIQHPWAGDPDRGPLPVFMMSYMNWYPGVEMEHIQGDWYAYTFRNASRTNSERLEFSTAFNYYNDRYGNGLSLQNLFNNNTHTEAYLIPEADSSMPLVAYQPPAAKVVAVFNPWIQTSPRLVSNGRVRPMRAVSGRCGWYAWALLGDSAGIAGYFRQNFGTETWGALGFGDTTTLDFSSVLLLQDTVWVVLPAASRGPAEIGAEPGDLIGPCTIPLDTMVVAATIRDFSTLFPDVQGNWSQANDKGDGICGVVPGLILPGLGADGKPVANPASTADIERCNATHLNLWFTTDTVVEPVNLRRYASCQDIPLVRDENRPGAGNDLYVFDDSYFLPLNNWQNPNHPTGSGDNFGFCMEISAQFTYQPGQVFDFRGDDDVWVFINDRLVIDIGGIHNPTAATVLLDTLSLVEGEEYPFAMFFCERQTSGSNIRINTSLDLRTSRRFQHNETAAGDGVWRYDLLENITTAGLGCSEQVSTGTNPARGRIQLSGPSLAAPVFLGAGTAYGGIRVAEDSTWFQVDTSSITGLLPGVYTIQFTDVRDSRLSGSITFEVAPFPIPDLRFITLDSAISTQPVIPGPWALVAYPVRLEAWYRNRDEHCASCSDTLRLQGPEGLEFRDSLGRVVDRVVLRGGFVSLWVTATTSMEDVAIHAAGPYPEPDMRATLEGMSFRLPDFAVPQEARIFDRDGDGVADSLWVRFDRPLEGDLPDSLRYRWPEDGVQNALGQAGLASHLQGENSLGFTGDFTEAERTAGSGMVHVVRTVEGTPVEFPIPIADYIGPVVLGARLQARSANIREVTVTLSEALSRADTLGAPTSAFLFHRPRAGILDGVIEANSARRLNDSTFLLVFAGESDALPEPGDSLRLAFAPYTLMDLQGNGPHARNPYRVIAGEATLGLESGNMVVVGPQSPGAEAGVEVIAVPTGSRAVDLVVQHGRLGHLVRNPLPVMMSELPEDTDPSSVYLVWETWYYTHHGSYVSKGSGEIRCDDEELFGGDCRQRQADLYLAWNPRAQDGRLLGTGAYIARMTLEARGPRGRLSKIEDTKIWGVRREN